MLLVCFPRYLVFVFLRSFLRAVGKNSVRFERGYLDHGDVGADRLRDTMVALIIKTCNEMKGCIP